MSSWHIHRDNAKKRGIRVAWSYAEFVQFCLETQYHVLKKRGFEIHRAGDVGPYCLAHCTCIKGRVNLRLEAVYRKIRAWRCRKAASA